MKETLCFLRKPQFEKNNPNFVWQSEKELVALSDMWYQQVNRNLRILIFVELQFKNEYT